MNDTLTEATAAADRSEDFVFQSEITDEALEAAAGSFLPKTAALTVAFCTGNLDCPF
jgi:hypothetical protein